MNERIKELAKQAGFMLWGNEPWNPGDVVDWSARYDDELAKFAELIVLECAKAIADDDLAKDCDTFLMDSYAKGMRYSVEVIKEHFGIKP